MISPARLSVVAAAASLAWALTPLALPPAMAQDEGSADVSESAVETSVAPATAWSMDPEKSTLGFSGTQTGNAFSGTFGRFSADILFDPDNLAGSSIAVTVATDSAATGDRQRDRAIPGGDWFAASQFPEAVFRSQTIRALDDGTFEADGALTVRDVSQPLTLPFSVTIAGDSAVADGTVTLNRRDFGVGRGEFETGKWVGLEVPVTFHIEATRAAN